MTPVTQLLTAVTITKTFSRNIFIAALRREIEVYHMSTIPLKYLLIKNLRKQASGPEALFSTYLDLLESNATQERHREFRKTVMEPYLNTHYQSVNHQTCMAEIASPSTAPNQGNPPTVPVNLNLEENSTSQKDISEPRKKYKAMRKWKRIGRESEQSKHQENFVLRIFSYNILAQNLLETHSYLYKRHDPRSLEWERRKELLTQEILEAQATVGVQELAQVICLQEMQQEHLVEFVKPFEEHGYKYFYKKRTNDKEDGLLLMYRSDTFNLVEFISVEFFQSGVKILNRDNVAIIVKLSLKDSPETEVVIATTHLLYNPRRNDVRLAQTQILMAELERIAFIENNDRSGPKYLPIIMTGDFNLPPKSGVYDFITQGSIRFEGRGRTLGSPDHNRLTNSLIPPHLHITDSCQHYHILVKRICNRGEGQVMLENSEKPPFNDVCKISIRNQYLRSEIDVQSLKSQQIEIANGHYVNFGSGRLRHPFRLQSVYSHTDCNGQSEATTNQDGWITVDYIFYSDVQLIEKYTLPTYKECKILSTIPNSGVGSDHLSLGATFIIHRKKRP